MRGVTVALFNDTGDAPHVGCLAVSDANRRLIQRGGMILRRVFYNREWQDWAGLPVREAVEQALRSNELRRAFEAVDAVLVNGEGTIHHGYGRHLLAILGAAQRLGWPTHLFNAVLQDVDDDTGLEVLRSLTSCAVRDECSAAWLRQHGIDHELHWDSLIEADFAREAMHDFAGRVVFTECHPDVSGHMAMELDRLRQHFGSAAVEYRFEGPERATDWRHVVADFQRARLVVTGRQHAMYVALLAGVPFVPLPSNSWKVQGLLRRFPEFPEWFASLRGTLAERAEWAVANGPAFVSAQLRLEATRPLNPFAHVRGGVAPTCTLGAGGSPDPARERALVDAARAVAAGGRVLCVGAFDISTVNAWYQEGFNVVAVEPARRLAGRATTATLLNLNQPERSFDLVVIGCWLEELDESLLPEAFAELARVSTDAVIFSMSGRPSPQTALARTERSTEWWETRLFEAGFSRHPRALRAAVHDTAIGPSVLVLQAPPAELSTARSRHPAIAGDDLLRAPGAAALESLHLYIWAANLIRPGDTVADVACGAGHGSAILWDLSEASQVQGWDVRAEAIAYAQAVYGTARPRLTFHVGNAGESMQAQVAAFDCIFCFDVVGDAAAERFLDAVAHALKPGGRLILSLPAQPAGVVPEFGRSHPPVWQVAALLGSVRRWLLLERVCWQSATDQLGRGEIRTLREDEWPVGSEAALNNEGTWVVVAMRDPVNARTIRYRETVFPPADATHVPPAVAFARDYENPWLVHSMVMGPYRVQSPRLLRELAERAREGAAAGSADLGAALCVLAYQCLQEPVFDETRHLEIMAEVKRYVARGEATNAHVKRWRVSLLYVLALLTRRLGKLDEAEKHFRMCGAADFMAFGPHLGTKCSDACFQAGRLALLRGDLDQAEADWRSVFGVLARIPWTDADTLLVNPKEPAFFEFGDGMREVTIISDNAARCANGLRVLKKMRRGRRLPGLVWDRAFQTTQAELVANAAVNHWEIATLRNQVAELQSRQEQLRRRITELDARNAQLRRAWDRRGSAQHVPIDKIVIFGAADGGRRVWEALCLGTHVEVMGFVDSDVRKQGRDYLGLPIRSPESLRGGSYDHVVVASIFADEIVSFLTSLGVDRSRVHIADLHLDDATLRQSFAQAFPSWDDPPPAPEASQLRAGIFGTGQGGAKVWEALMGLDHVTLAWFSDNDSRKHGQQFMGLKIIPPAQILAERVDRVVIASMHRDEIEKQLRAMGVAVEALVAPDVTRSFSYIANELTVAFAARDTAD